MIRYPDIFLKIDERKIKINKIEQIGNIFPSKTRENPNQGRVYNPEGVSPTLGCMQGGNRQPFIIEDFYKNRDIRVYENSSPTIRSERNGLKVIKVQKRVRRLTPKECWRLFDFSDEDFNKAKNALNNTYFKGRDRSDSQLYKQAGNTIIINTLAAIINQLHITEHIDVAEFFSGIGAQRKALEKCGLDFTVVDSVDIEPHSVTSYNAIFNTEFEPQDITQWDKDIHIDMLFHTSPCQDMSVAGLNKGADEGSGTRSSLMHEAKRIVAKTTPKYVIWENVKGALSPKNKHNFEKYISDMNELGYHTYYQVCNGLDYGTPQSRERIFAVSIRKDIDCGYEFPKPIPLTKCLNDILEDEVDEKYYVKQELADKLIKQIQNKKVSNTVRAGGRGSLDRHSWDLVVG